MGNLNVMSTTVTTPDDPARHGIGANNPPPEAELSPFDKLVAEANALIEIGNKWTTERPEITDADMAQKAGTFRDKLKKVRDALDRLRLDEKKDFETWLMEKFGPHLGVLDKARAAIVDKIDTWLKAEQRRLDEERRVREAEARRQREEAEAARRKAEEAARQAGADALRAAQEAEDAARRAAEAEKIAAAPLKAKITGTGGRTISGRTTWHARIVDEDKALAHFQGHAVVRQAALAAALRLAEAEAKLAKRADAAPPGFAFFDEQKAA